MQKKSYLTPAHSLPEQSLAAIRRQEMGGRLGQDARKIDRQIARLRKLILEARRAFEADKGLKIVVEPATAFLPLADV
jgi:hypothetical protein